MDKWEVKIKFDGVLSVPVEVASGAGSREEAKVKALAKIKGLIEEGDFSVLKSVGPSMKVKDAIGREVVIPDNGVGFRFFYYDFEPWITNGIILVRVEDAPDEDSGILEAETLEDTIATLMSNLKPAEKIGTEKVTKGTATHELDVYGVAPGKEVFIDSALMGCMEGLDSFFFGEAIDNYNPIVGGKGEELVCMLMNFDAEKGDEEKGDEEK